MPICWEILGYELCVPSVDDITKSVSESFKKQMDNLTKAFNISLSTWLSHAQSNIINSITSSFTDSFADWLKDLANLFNPWMMAIQQWLSSINFAISGVKATIDLLNRNIATSIGQLGLQIQQSVMNSMTTLAEQINGFNLAFTHLIESLGQWSANIVGELAGIKEQFGSFGSVFEVGMHNWSMGLYSTLMQQIVPNLPSVIQFVYGIARNTQRQIEQIVEENVEKLSKAVIGYFAGEETGVFLLDIWTSIIEGFAEGLYEALSSVFLYEPPATPEKAIENVKRYLALVMRFPLLELTARIIELIIGLIGDIEIFGTKLPGYAIAYVRPFSSTVRSLYWNLGFGWMTWTIWSGIFRYTIQEPLNKYYRSQYLPQEPTVSTILEVWRRGYIDDKKLKELLQYFGYPEKWHQYMKYANMYYPPPSEILDWYHRGLIELEDAHDLLRRYGIDEKYIEFYIKNSYNIPSVSNILEAYNRKLIDERTAITYLQMHKYKPEHAQLLVKLSKQELSRTIVEELYVREIINKEQFVDMLERLGYTKEQIELIEQTLEYLPSRSMIEEWYVRGFISKEQAIQMLKQLGYKDKTIELILKSLKQELSYSTLFELYEWGTIDEKQLLERLQKLGFRDTELVLMQELAKIRAISDELSQIRTRVGNLYADGVLTREDAKDILMKLGYPEEQVDLYLDAKHYSRLSEIISNYVSAVLIEFRDGKIDEATCRLMLAPYIKDPERIESMIALYRSLRMKEPAFILPPVFKDRAEYVKSVIESLQKQVEHLQKIVDMLEEEYDFLIGRIQQYKAQAPPELQESLDKQIKILEESKQLREQYYGTLLFQLYLYLNLYTELLQKYGGAS